MAIYFCSMKCEECFMLRVVASFFSRWPQNHSFLLFLQQQTDDIQSRSRWNDSVFAIKRFVNRCALRKYLFFCVDEENWIHFGETCDDKFSSCVSCEASCLHMSRRRDKWETAQRRNGFENVPDVCCNASDEKMCEITQMNVMKTIGSDLEKWEEGARVWSFESPLFQNSRIIPIPIEPESDTQQTRQKQRAEKSKKIRNFCCGQRRLKWTIVFY